jgi:membrane protein
MSSMNSLIRESRDTFNAWVWGDDLRTLGGVRLFLVRALRLLYVLIRDLFRGQLSLRAMSLVYTTLLALVPLLAVSFSVLKGFGVHNQVEPLLLKFLEPLGSKGQEIVVYVIQFVENVKVGVLGSVGLALLIYTVISLIQKIEGAFNDVWRIESQRSFSQRFSNYLSVILIGPVMMFTALGITASVMNNRLVQYVISIEPFGLMLVELGRLVPYLLVCLAFTFVYVFLPNTRVKLGAGLTGGLVAGFLWQTTGWAFAAFIANSTRYAAIYSSFAILILLLIWLYINWLVLLVGAQISFYVQNPQYLTMKQLRLVLSNRFKEHLALVIMYLVASNHYHKREPWRRETLAQRLDLPDEPVQGLLAVLVESGYLVETAADPCGYLPAMASDTVQVADLLAAVRQAGEGRFLSASRLASVVPFSDLMQRIENAPGDVLQDTTLRSLVLAEQAADTAERGTKQTGK